MFRKIYLWQIVLCVFLLFLALGSLVNIDDAFLFYSETQERLRKASVDAERTREQIEIIQKNTHANVSVLEYGELAEEGKVHKIELRGTLPVPEVDGAFDPADIQFEIRER